MASQSVRTLRNILNLASKSKVFSVSSIMSRKISMSLFDKKSLKVLARPSNIFNSYGSVQTRYFAGHADDESVEESTMNVLKLFDKVDPSKVTLDAHFINDLGLDSLDVVEVVMAFEDEFGIEISDEEAEKVLTVQQAVDLIKAKLDS